MKRFKQFEFYSNLLLILLFILILLITRSAEYLFTAYFTVGAIQVVSMIVHIVNKWFTGKKSFRRYYHFLVCFLLLLVPTGIGILILLYSAPLLAITYTFICWRELQALSFREFVHLK